MIEPTPPSHRTRRALGHKPDLALRLAVALVFLFLLFPVLVVLLSAFSGTDAFHFPPRGWSLRWFAAAAHHAEYARSLSISFIVAFTSALLATASGAAAAFALTRAELRGRGAIVSVLMAPLMLPQIAWAVGLLALTARLGASGSIAMMTCIHATVAIPIVSRILLSSCSQLDWSLWEAALMLGASRARATMRVLLPLLAPGLLSSYFLAFVGSFNEVTISTFVASYRTMTFPVRVYVQMRSQGIDLTAVAISAAIVLAVIGGGLLAERKLRWSRWFA